VENVGVSRDRDHSIIYLRPGKSGEVELGASKDSGDRAVNSERRFEDWRCGARGGVGLEINLSVPLIRRGGLLSCSPSNQASASPQVSPAPFVLPPTLSR
jgi:hypothetical protein